MGEVLAAKVMWGRLLKLHFLLFFSSVWINKLRGAEDVKVKGRYIFGYSLRWSVPDLGMVRWLDEG